MKKTSTIKSNENARCVINENGKNEILEIKSLKKLEDISQIEKDLIDSFTLNQEHLSGDIKRELLRLIEAPIANESLLPNTEFVQLRHVEFAANRYAEYREWRYVYFFIQWECR